nr:HipA domain-containing protein [Bacteroidales bacterium]
GELSYLTKRIDRLKGGKKVHMLDMFQITEAFDKYKSSHEKVGKAILAYAANTQFDILRFFEIVVFSYLVGNNDMHLKNFSLIKNEDGWGLSPAYDLLNVNIVLPEDKEELALTLEGKKSNFSKDYFVAFGKNMNLSEKQISGVFSRFEKKESKAISFIQFSFLSRELQNKYIDLLIERYRMF